MLSARLLLGAAAPGVLIAALRLTGSRPLVAILLVLLALLSVGSVLLLLRARHSINQQPYELTAITDESAQVPGYLLGFVFPFMFIDGAGWREATAYVAVGILVAVLVLRTDLVYVQPLLLAAGYHFYRVETKSGYSGLLLSSVRPRVGQTVQAVVLSPASLKLTAAQ